MIRLHEVSFGYDKDNVIDDVSIDLKNGWTSIVGPNGAGKSTLINLMNGMLKANQGSVELNNKNIHLYKPDERARLISTIHQQPDTRFPITCFDMVSFGRYPWQSKVDGLTDRDYEIIHEAMLATQTIAYKDKAITDLSGGEKQRVILACALAQEPEVLLIDEGFSALDIKHKSEMIQCLKQIMTKRDMTVVAIIHDLNVAYLVSDQVILLKEGSVIRHGHTKETMTKPLIESVYETQVHYDQHFGFAMHL